MPAATQHAPLEPVPAVLAGVVLLHLLTGGLVWLLLPFLPASLFSKAPETLPNDGRYWFSPADFKRAGEAPVVTPQAPSTPSGASVPPAPVVAPPAMESVPVPVTAPVNAAPLATTSAPHEVPGTLADTPLPSTPGPTTPANRPANKVITLSPVLELPSQAIPFVPPTRAPVTLMDMLKLEKLEEEKKQALGGADMDPILRALEKALKEQWNAPPVNDVPVTQREVRLTISIGRDGGILEARMSKPSGSAVLDESVSKAGDELKKISESLPASLPKDRYTVEVNFHID